MDLKGYIDGNGLVSNTRVTSYVGRASDNGVLFTSQALLLMDTSSPALEHALDACVDSNGVLHRAPDDTSLDAPDDHYGLISALVYHDLKIDRLSLAPRLWHPVLVYLYARMRNSLLYYALSPLVTIIIALSNLGSPKEDTSNRLLTWTICQALKRRGLITGLASRVWEWRQRRIYGSLSKIFSIYFGEEHPFTRELVSRGE